MKPLNYKHESNLALKFLIIFFAFIVVSMILSCAVQKPVVKQFTVIRVHDGFFAAKNGKTILLFGTQDSVYVGKVINVSIGKK